MNLGTLIKAFDTVMALKDVAQKALGPAPGARADTGLTQTAPAGGGLTGQLETHLTNVVVAALKEAFARDHARLELERAQLEEGRRRAEEALRLETRRQAIDREIGRLRLLTGMALAGWIGAVALFVARMDVATLPSRIVVAVAWLLLLAAMATAFTGQERVARLGGSDTADGASGPGTLAVYLLTGGLALAAVSLMF